MNADLARARAALDAGRRDEATVHAWNALVTLREEADRDELFRIATELDEVLLLRELDDRRLARPPAEPAAEPERAPGKLRFLPFALLLVIMTVLAVTDMPTEGRPPDVDEAAVRDRPEPHPQLLTLRDGVWLVPVERAETVDLQRLADELTLRHGIPVGVQAPVTLTPSTLQKERDDPEAERLLELLATAYPAEGRTAVIGVTDHDMDSPTHGHVFTLRSQRNYAIVSTAQLGGTILDRLRGHDRHERTRKLIARDIGFLYLGLPTVDDPHSLLRSSMSAIDDIDALDENLAR